MPRDIVAVVQPSSPLFLVLALNSGNCSQQRDPSSSLPDLLQATNLTHTKICSHPCHWILKPGLPSPLPSPTPGSGCFSIGLPSLPSSLAPIQTGGCDNLAQPGPHQNLALAHANVLWLSLALLSSPPKSAHIPANKCR